MQDHERVQKKLQGGGWLSPEKLFETVEEGYPVSVLMSDGRVYDGLWHYDINWLQVESHLQVVGWKTRDVTITFANRFMNKFFRTT